MSKDMCALFDPARRYAETEVHSPLRGVNPDYALMDSAIFAGLPTLHPHFRGIENPVCPEQPLDLDFPA